jgi:coenzyme PQQ precursor peptide PqqA
MARPLLFSCCHRAAHVPDWVNSPTPRPVEGASSLATVNLGEETMTWTKPEFEVVEVTMEVTAYVARR